MPSAASATTVHPRRQALPNQGQYIARPATPPPDTRQPSPLAQVHSARSKAGIGLSRRRQRELPPMPLDAPVMRVADFTVQRYSLKIASMSFEPWITRKTSAPSDSGL